MANHSVADHDTEHYDPNSAWGGGERPFRASYGKLMMWYFLLSDAFTFGGFLIAYGALRFSSPSWPLPDAVFATGPFNNFGFGDSTHLPLVFVTIMSFLLIISSVTMVRAVQEGHRENKNGVVFWMLMTVLGGLGFLSCQAWEWNNLISKEHLTIGTDPFGTHTMAGVYLDDEGKETDEVFKVGTPYLIHKLHSGHGAEGQAGHVEMHEGGAEHQPAAHHEEEAAAMPPGDYPGFVLDEQMFKHRKFKVTEGAFANSIQSEQFGPKAFGGLFFFITGFHGFHVFSGVVFLLIILINAASGVYVKRKNGYEMVEKIGLYWHFVDLVWVFVFLVFYLL